MGGKDVIRERLLLILFVSLLLACSSIASSNDGSNANSIQSSDAPLFDYRYSQVAEELGLLKNGTSEGKLEYGSVETASLTPLDTPQKKGCRLQIKQADLTMGVCQWETEQTCFDSCGSTCSGTCGGTCGSTCGDTCGYTCSSTCRASCSNTCGDTCGGTCGYTCSSTCGATCSYTCRDTCGSTCLDSCRTCSLSCGASTCSNTCDNTCKDTCMRTCSRTCARTCSNTCANTCGQTCSATCSATCQAICQPTCSATCGQACASSQPAAVARSSYLHMAKSTAKAPLAAEQITMRSYNIVAMPPTSVYYLGAYSPWTAFQKSFAEKEIYAWVETEAGWDVIASTPRGTWVRQFVFVPANENVILNEIAPDGKVSTAKFDPVGPGYKYVWFYAKDAGTYVGSFESAGQKSNNVTLQVC